MQIKFTPCYTITPRIAQWLLRIEVAKETARLVTTHYSTMIEGNQLDIDEVQQVLQHQGYFPGRERDEREVKGYYVALQSIEQWAQQKKPLTEALLRIMHALVMGGGKKRVTPTPYRDGQNMICDGRTKAIVYLPPEAKNVPQLMTALIRWISEQAGVLPFPLLAGIAHYQFATIHPYYDGNGRTARLLTTFLLHWGGYDLKGLYSLEEYYARHLDDYYHAIAVGPSHNYTPHNSTCGFWLRRIPSGRFALLTCSALRKSPGLSP